MVRLQFTRTFILLFVLVFGMVWLDIPIRGLNSGRADSSTVRIPAIPETVRPARPLSEDNYARIPYFTESAGMSSTLTLNNNLPEPTQATVTVFSSKGQPFTAPTITLHSQTAERFSLAKLTENAGGDFKSGSVQVFYHGPLMAVTCQVTIFSEKQRLSFESVETSAMEFSSSRLDGIVWLPDDDTRARVALTNTTNDILNVAITSSQEGSTDSRNVSLGPQEMRLVDLKEFVKSNKEDSGASLLSLLHNGAPGAVVATGFALNEKKGFSCNLPFVDRSTAKTTHLAGAHVRFGRADAREGFPPGTRFLAPLVIANAGETPTEARVFVDYTIGSTANRLEVGEFSLAPQGVKQVELSKEMAHLGVNGPVDDAGLDIDYAGSAGAVMGRLVSYDSSGDYSFDVPVKDPLAEMNRVGGSYPWRLDDGYSTVLHLKNTIGNKVYALVQVRYEGGTYNLERLPLQPFQTIAVDVLALREGKQKDIRGGVMPKQANGGQVIWYEETVGSLIGRAEVRNLAEAVASSFSCGTTCSCPPSFQSASISPSSMTGAIGDSSQFQCMETRADCFSTYGPYDRTLDSTWTTTNAGVASVTSTGFVSCVGIGGCSINAQFSAIVYTTFPSVCSTQTVNPNPGSGVQVINFALTLSPNAINSSGVGGTSTSTITVQTTPATANVGVTLFLSVVVGGDTAGHISHTGTRPLGTLSATQGTTAANGTFQSTYTAPIFAGPVIIGAQITGGQVSRADTMAIGVGGLASLGAGTNYNLVGATATHPDNHYGTATAQTNLPLIADDYKAQFYFQNPIPDGEKLRYNDMSLVLGGKFDIAGNWCLDCSHAEHRLGINCDVGSSNVPTARWSALTQIFINRGSPNYLDETATLNHWHLRFQ